MQDQADLSPPRRLVSKEPARRFVTRLPPKTHLLIGRLSAVWAKIEGRRSSTSILVSRALSLLADATAGMADGADRRLLARLQVVAPVSLPDTDDAATLHTLSGATP